MKNETKIAVNTGYFYRDPILNAAKRIISCGFTGVELDGLPILAMADYLRRDLKRLLAGEGIRCVSVSAVADLVPINLGNLASLNKKEKERAVGHLKKCLDFAAFFSASNLVCDTGTTCEDFVKSKPYDQSFAESLDEILGCAADRKVKVVLLNVPGRRWHIWDGLPPDSCRVVERHVWPWRAWPDREEIVPKYESLFSKRIRWALDTANEFVAHGVHSFKLAEVAGFYLNHKLGIVYLANHPGPYNKVWHRFLLHQSLWNGFSTIQDYRAMFKTLQKKFFKGEIVLQVREKEPAEESLKRNLAFCKKCLALSAVFAHLKNISPPCPFCQLVQQEDVFVLHK